MGDFERTFGAGADAVSIVDGFAREREKEPYGGGSRAMQAASKRNAEGDTIFAELGSGLKLVRKASIEAFYDEANDLDRDGRLYGNDHTIFISYGNEFSPEEATESLAGALLLVLRDSSDITRALIGVVDNKVRHLLGLDPVKHRHFSDPLFSAFRSHNWKISTEYSIFGWISNDAGKWLSVMELPAEFTAFPGINLSNTDISSLPERMTVGGDLDLSGTKIENLANGLTVGGNLNLKKTALGRLPKELTVGGRIYVGSYRVVLPPQGSITEEFDPFAIPFSSRINVVIGGDLRLDISALAILPRGATVIASSHDFGDPLSELVGKLPDGVMYMRLPDNRYELIKKSEMKYGQ